MRFKEAEDSYAEALKCREDLLDDGARVFLGIAELKKKMGRDDAAEMYFRAGVVSSNLLMKYGLPSIDFLSCFRNAHKLTPEGSRIRRVASIAIAALTQITTKEKPNIDEIRGLEVDDLPDSCRAVANSLMEQEAKAPENNEARDDVEFMSYSLYSVLRERAKDGN